MFRYSVPLIGPIANAFAGNSLLDSRKSPKNRISYNEKDSRPVQDKNQLFRQHEFSLLVRREFSTDPVLQLRRNGLQIKIPAERIRK